MIGKKPCLYTYFLVLVSMPVAAETYSWTDENGTVNFTEDRSNIPKKYRKKAKQLGNVSSGESAEKGYIKPILPKTPTQAQGAQEVATGSGVAEKYNGRTYDQWKLELTTLEASMASLRKKIEELDLRINKNGVSQEIVQERNVLAKQYNELVAEYDRTVEAARKAGLKVEIR